jgi:aminoglycoside/choline kinase family phosphotransferase
MGGFLSRTFHATRPGNRESYILKIGSQNPVARNFSSKIHSFLRECAAYSLLPSLAGKVVPKCFSSCSTPDGADGLLCLQEVTRARSGDQIAGLSWKELAKTAKSIGIIHAHLWGSARKGDLPLHQYNRAHESKSLLKSFLKEFRPRLSKSEIKRVRNIPKTVSIAIQQSKKRPITLIHGDLRADNLLFSKGRVFIVDWQIAAWGLGSFDLARVIGGSTQRPLSLSEQRKLVKIWHQTLKRKNVSGYSFEEAWQDYRIGVALTLSIPITNAPTLAHLSIRGKKIAHLMMRRFFRNGREFGLF